MSFGVAEIVYESWNLEVDDISFSFVILSLLSCQILMYNF